MLRRLLLLSIFFFCACIGATVFFLEYDHVDFSALDAYKATNPTIVYDDQGAELARFECDKRAPVLYADLPGILVKAFVAAEDHAFFSHPGISMRGIIRSTLVNLYNRRIVQGASTITQQLARLMFLSHERTWYRKIREIFITLQLERQLSKEQILELYLNNIYFGRGIYGVQAACRRMWDKSLNDITIDQAATLAAVAASARLYSPLNAPANAQRRRNLVLSRMRRLNFISPDEYEQAVNVALSTQDYFQGNPIRLYLQEWIRIWAEGKWGKEALYGGGMKIKTTINTTVQERAEKAFSTVVQQLRTRLGDSLNGGLMSITPQTGAIKAVIGGYDFRQSQYNRSFQAQRQMGSSFKPILYALAMRAGIEMDTIFVDEPFEMQMPSGNVWRPMNWHNRFEGAMTLVRALTSSCNIIAIKLFLKIGGHYVVPWTRLFGIHRCLTEYPSAALGTAEASVEENVAAFNVFANNGVYTKPYLIEWVKDQYGNKCWQAVQESHRIIDSTLNSRMVNLLSQRMILAKKRDPNWFDAESIGKSGSTNGAATTWFVGATPELTTALYVGCDDNKPMGSQLLSGRTTFPMWASFYKSLTFNKKRFYKDPQLREVLIDWVTGKHAVDPNASNVVTLLKS